MHRNYSGKAAHFLSVYRSLRATADRTAIHCFPEKIMEIGAFTFLLVFSVKPGADEQLPFLFRPYLKLDFIALALI